jgi:hypothetical protein
MALPPVISVRQRPIDARPYRGFVAHRHCPAPAVALPVDALARTRTVWGYGLGLLWLLDALLQAQPSMFTPNFVQGVILPAAQGQPDWIAGPMQWGAQLWSQQPVFWNAAAVGLELVIGLLLLVGGQRHRAWGRAGLWLSIGWGLVVWSFGEGLGGLATGSASYLVGAPGSALLYVLLASLLLLPEAWWRSPRLLWTLQAGGAALWALGAVLQLAPLYWTPLGLASVLQNVAMMPLPFGLAALDAPLVASLANAPVVWNLALIGVMLLPAGLLLVGRQRRLPYLVLFAWILFLWVVFQGGGMLLSGMSTDPNTPPLWVLLLLPGWFAACGRPARATTDAA